MSYVTIDIDVDDVAEQLTYSKFKQLATDWIHRNEASMTPERRREIGKILKADMRQTYAYSANHIDDLKLQDIIPNLWKKSMEEIQQIFC